MLEVSIVLIGSVLFLGALARFRQVYLISSISGRKDSRVRWLLLGLTVVGFLVGYLIFIFHLLASLVRTPSDQLVSVIFFGGSVFVFVCANLFYSTTDSLVNALKENDLQKTKLNQQATTLKTSVDQKTLELLRERARLAEATTRAEQLDKERLEARMVANQRLESIELMASGIAHDFNNLLVGILGNASYAKQLGPNEGADLIEALEDVEEAADRASELTNQLSSYCGKNRTALQAIDLSELSKEMLSIMRTSIDAKVEVVRDLTDDGPVVWGDSARLRQLIMNLVVNGCEAILPSNGLLFIRTGLVELGEEGANGGRFQDPLPPGSYAYLEVEDQGCGISELDQVHAFEPFFSTKGLGRGLGLAAAQGIVRSHNGGLTLSSVKGEGTKIRAIFPISPNEADKKSVIEDLKQKWARGGRILAVDDELIVLDTIRRGLERVGFSVETVSKESEFFEVINQANADYSAAIVDIMMPDIVFEEMFEALRSRFPQMPILVSSGYSEIDIEGILGDDALLRFLTKPYRIDELVKAITVHGEEPS
jgi:signal transduction histidine kinase/ActR/RegA family two-component response regulator